MSKDTKRKLRYEMDKYKRLGGKVKQLELTDSKEKKKKKKKYKLKKGSHVLKCPLVIDMKFKVKGKKPLNKKET